MDEPEAVCPRDAIRFDNVGFSVEGRSAMHRNQTVSSPPGLRCGQASIFLGALGLAFRMQGLGLYTAAGFWIEAKNATFRRD